jgi:NMD protein affecting ribosome stability and mRNA decay
MGMFDSVMVDCPTCGHKIEHQSKVGDCVLDVFSLENAPYDVAISILNEPEFCRKCENWSVVTHPDFPPRTAETETQPATLHGASVQKVRSPDTSEMRMHTTQTYLRWWDTEFKLSDILPPK